MVFLIFLITAFYNRYYANTLTKSWINSDFPHHYKEQFLQSKIIKIEQDGIPPLLKIHLLSKSGCIYVVSPAGRTLSLENPAEVEADPSCIKEAKNTK